MVAVLITGMSGAGKSTALAGLARRGAATVDTDEGSWIELRRGEPLWVPDRIDALLARPLPRPLFVAGTVANQARWYDRFEAVVLLTAPLDVLLDRVRTRTGNPFGRTVEDRAAITRDAAEVEPLLRASATHVIDTEAPARHVVDVLVQIAADVRSAASDGTRQA